MSADLDQQVIDSVAADAHAEQRLHDGHDVALHDGGRGSVACLDTPDYSVYVYANRNVDRGDLHEAMAATFLELGLSLNWQQAATNGDRDE